MATSIDLGLYLLECLIDSESVQKTIRQVSSILTSLFKGEASSDTLTALPDASSQPIAVELSMDAVKGVQVSLIPIEVERREPLLPEDGSIQSVKAFSGLNLIRPDLQPMQMEKLTFDSFEAFVFTPIYADCHEVEFYLFGVQDGKAFPMVFQVEGNEEEKSFYISPLATPKVVENKLVVDGGYAAGMDDRTRYTFQPDLPAKRMVLVKQESIPI